MGARSRKRNSPATDAAMTATEYKEMMQGFANAERRTKHENALMKIKEDVDMRQVMPLQHYSESNTAPVPQARSSVNYKFIAVAFGSILVGYAIVAFVAANAVAVGGVAVLALIVSALRSAPGGNSYMGSPGGEYRPPSGNSQGGGQNINVTINASTGGNVNVTKQ